MKVALYSRRLLVTRGGIELMINKLIIKRLDMKKFCNQYKIFRVHKNDDTMVINDSRVCIYSLAYKDSATFYALTKTDCNRTDLFKIFSSNHYDVVEVSVGDLSDDLLLQLFINKQANPKLTFNNLNAELYCINEKKKNQIITFAFSISNDMILSCNIKTFSMLTEKTLPKFSRKSQKSIEQGKTTTFEERDGYLVRKILHGQYGYYINRTYKTSSKNTRDFFAIDASDHKTAEMFRLIRKVNNADPDCIELGFMDIEYTRMIEEKRLVKDIFKKILQKFPENTIINVIDNCNQEKKIKSLFKKAGIGYRSSSHVLADELNLSIIKSKKEYENLDEEDRYKRDKNFIIQNIESKHLTETVLKQCLLEFIIKREAVNGQIYTVDLRGKWDFYQIINKMVHCLSVLDNKIIGVSSLNIPEEITDRLTSIANKDPKMIVHDSNAILIIDTDIRLMPDWNAFVESRADYVIDDGDKIVNKARTYRNKLYGEIIDVNSFRLDNKKFYSVGEIGYGMNTTISNSPATKEVIEEGLTIEDICFLMLPNIYQVNKYAVYPYPYKLMNEIFRMNGGVIVDD